MEKVEPYEIEENNITTEYIPQPADRLTFLDVNETEAGESRGIFRDVEPVVVVLVSNSSNFQKIISNSRRP
jgi:hypothetical protein